MKQQSRKKNSYSRLYGYNLSPWMLLVNCMYMCTTSHCLNYVIGVLHNEWNYVHCGKHYCTTMYRCHITAPCIDATSKWIYFSSTTVIDSLKTLFLNSFMVKRKIGHYIPSIRMQIFRNLSISLSTSVFLLGIFYSKNKLRSEKNNQKTTEKNKYFVCDCGTNGCTNW